MSTMLPLMNIDQACRDAINWVIQQLTSTGLQTLRTFDLQAVEHVHTEHVVACRACPHYGMGPCDCQMIVLLVYQGSRPPVSLFAHGYNEHTWLYLVDTPQQRADPHLEATIRQALIRSPLLVQLESP